MEAKLRYLNVQREKMSPLVRAYWAELDQAQDLGKPVIYCLGIIPQELFRVVDGVVFHGENFSAGAAVARLSRDLCDAAESRGFPPELCSYARTHIGAMTTGRNPMGKTLPKPDLVAYVNGRCSAYAGWGKAIKDIYPDVPVFALDVPPLQDDMSAEDRRDAKRHISRQIEELITFLDGWRGKRFDRDRLGEMVGHTGEAARAFVALHDTLRTAPAPISLIDIFFQLFPIVCLKGQPEAAMYYRAAKSEVDRRIAEGYAAVPDERFRIYWDGIAIWSRLTSQFQQFARYGAAMVSAAYSYNMADLCSKYDSARPMESLADGLLDGYSNMGLRAKVDYVTRLIKDFRANAIIMQVSRSCKPFFLDEVALIKQVAERTGVPYCEVHGDMADPRLYSEKEIEERLEAFLTRLAAG